MEEEIKLNHTEKRHYFIYLVIMFVVITGILMALIFRKSPNPFSTASYSDVSFINQEQFFLEKQKEAVPLYDSVLVKIEGLQNVPTNLVLEIDIKNQINTLNSYYENLSNRDPRFIGFKQMAVFEKMHFEDMLVMKKKMENIKLFQSQLDQCQIGYKDKETRLNQLRTIEQGIQQN
ncbi:type VI secretion system TssO [Pedobacter nototheniae]|uniref:type VI secretion system TssO n=1 Tax=Pedobacter nototheniae TaxID=2488994 RepID=UPI0010401815|nr:MULTISPECIES: type VI secretion system TssO [Pedobacter]